MSDEVVPVRRMLRLHEIETGFLDALDAWEAAETDEDRDAAELEIQRFLSLEVTKVDNYIGFLLDAESYADAARSERERLDVLLRRWEGRIQRVKRAALYVMQRFEMKKLEGTLGSLRRQANAPKVEVTDITAVPEGLISITVKMTVEEFQAIKGRVKLLSVSPTEVMRAEILKRLKAGEAVPGAAIAAPEEHLRIVE